MPPLPDVPNVIKVVHTGQIFGQPWAGVSHWRYVMTLGGIPTNAQLLEAMAKFVNSWRDHLRPQISHDCSDISVEGIDLTSPTSAVAVAADGDFGADAGNIISPESCVLVTKTVGRRYRGGHPRTYWPGLAEAWTDEGRRAMFPASVPTLVDAYQAYYDDIPPAVTTDGLTGMSSFHEVSVSYHSGGAIRPVPLVDDVLGRTVQPVFATQRRRMHRP